MRESILKVRESDKVLCAGIIQLFCTSIVILLGIYEIEITGWEDVIILGFLATMFAGIGIFCIIAKINHKLDVYEDGSLCYQAYSGKSVEFTIDDIDVIEQKSNTKETSILIKGKKGQTLAKVESNMKGYYELLRWLEIQGIKGVESETIKVVEDTEEVFYQKKEWIKKLRIINNILLWSMYPILYIVRESLTAVCWLGLLYPLIWFMFYLCFHKVMYFVLPWNIKREEKEKWKSKHVYVNLAPLALWLLVKLIPTFGFTNIKGNEFLFWGVLFVIGVVSYFAVAWRDRLLNHFVIVFLLSVYCFATIIPLNLVFPAEDPYKTEWGVIQGKRILDGKYGIVYYLEVELERDNVIYDFDVDRDTYFGNYSYSAIELDVWESRFGFEYAQFPEIEY